jgi:nucleoside-diphosphate-sugar epimerase
MGTMKRVLLTGSSGLVGRAAGPALEAAGWEVRPFDMVRGDDLRDPEAVHAAVAGCSMVVHAGAIPHDSKGPPADIMATNVLGTWHVLEAAEANGVERVVYFSSAQVFGCAEGEGEPVYTPVDDDHPLLAARPYGLSKRMTEVMCEAWTSRTGIPTVLFRPVLVVTDETLAQARAGRTDLRPFVHVADVADAVVAALSLPVKGHSRMILSGPGWFDSGRAESVLGWRAARVGERVHHPGG